MKSGRRNVTFLIVKISVIGFLIHLAWEYVQCSPLFLHLKVGPTFWSMICATVGDVGIFWTSYFLVVALTRSLLWPLKSHGSAIWVVFAGLSAGIAEVAEYFAINRGFWAYSSINPTIGGVSVVPGVQMVTINPLTILISKKLLFLRESTTKKERS